MLCKFNIISYLQSLTFHLKFIKFNMLYSYVQLGSLLANIYSYSCISYINQLQFLAMLTCRNKFLKSLSYYSRYLTYQYWHISIIISTINPFKQPVFFRLQSSFVGLAFVPSFLASTVALRGISLGSISTGVSRDLSLREHQGLIIATNIRKQGAVF